MSAEQVGILAAVTCAVGVGVGLAIGLGWRRADRDVLEAERTQLRSALRFARGVAIERGIPSLARFIERVLEEPTGT